MANVHDLTPSCCLSHSLCVSLSLSASVSLRQTDRNASCQLIGNTSASVEFLMRPRARQAAEAFASTSRPVDVLLMLRCGSTSATPSPRTTLDLPLLSSTRWVIVLELLLELLLHMHALSACHESLSSAPQFPIDAQWVRTR